MTTLYPDEIAVMRKAVNGKAVTASGAEIGVWRGLCEAGLAYECGFQTPRAFKAFRTYRIGPTGAELLAAISADPVLERTI